MTTKRKFSYDRNLDILTVKAITEDRFTGEQVNTIIKDLEAKVRQADEMLEKVNNMEKVLEKMKDKTVLEVLKTISMLVPQIQLPNKESTEKTRKYWEEFKKKNSDDLKELRKYAKGGKS